MHLLDKIGRIEHTHIQKQSVKDRKRHKELFIKRSEYLLSKNLLTIKSFIEGSTKNWKLLNIFNF